MGIDEYEKEMAIQFGYLNQIDIEKYMKNCKSSKVGDLISAIERDYDDTEFTNNDFWKDLSSIDATKKSS